MRPRDLFRHCPRCGTLLSEPRARDAVNCHHCGLVYYFNPATAAAAFIFNDLGEALFIRRAKEPSQGKLALPGGFVDHGEDAENGVRREIREEVGLEVTELRYLCSAANQYPYRSVTYSVLDVLFTAKASSASRALALDGVQSCVWLKPSRVDPAEIAFNSIRQGLRVLLEGAPQ